MYQEPESSKFIAPLRAKYEAFFRRSLEQKIISNEAKEGFWVVRHKETNAFIGTGNLNLFSLKDVTHVGCHLRTKSWGNGFGYEVMHRLKHYGIDDLELTAVPGFVEYGHVASKAIMIKMGYKLIEQMDAEVVLNYYRCSEKPSKS
ncbi:MAG: RimJ/RimL family protein N-acetyltransferase [Flavobacteriales bacterium]|jgi:RimJ/RimL family protein N-acetyltransferase